MEDEKLLSMGGTSRRDFIKKTALASAGLSAGLFASGNFAYAGGKDTLRVGLIGCGGRGTGAARNCVNAAENVELYAMGDLFPDRLESSREILKQAIGDGCNVTPDRAFSGLEAYKKVIRSDVDLVLLATPPAFRPSHFEDAVKHNRHVFIEKPVAVDPAGVKSIRRTAKLAESKGLSVMSGLQYRKQNNYIHAMEMIHSGNIGRPVAAQAEYLAGGIWYHERTDEMSEMEWQLRNWYYYTWLSGDFIVEQFVHNLDTILWAYGSLPLMCTGVGGRQARVASEFGNIYDHFSITYDFPEGRMLSATCRQFEGSHRNVTNRIIGSDASVFITPNHTRIEIPGQAEPVLIPLEGDSPQQIQKRRLVESIRKGIPVNEAEMVADATLMAVMGREAAYTGRQITWDEIRESDLNLMPDQIDFEHPIHDPVAIPGSTPLNRTRL